MPKAKIDPDTAARDGARAGLVRSVQTPLGFFVLVVLVVEAILGVVVGATTGFDRSVTIAGMLIIIAGLIATVAFLAYYRPEALRGDRPPATSPSELLPEGSESVETVEISAVFCAVTPQFEELGADADVDVLQKTFPGKVTIQRRASSDSVREILTARRFTIVHLLGYVDTKSGAFVFGDDDAIPADGLLKLLEVCGARLVFLATCDSLLLGAKLARRVDVVAATDSVLIELMLSWERCFYQMLERGRRLSEAYEVAQATTQAPMVLIMRKDAVFASSGGAASRRLTKASSRRSAERTAADA